MAAHTNGVIQPFDFSEALKHRPEERIRLCVERVRNRLMEAELWDIFGVPPVPEGGASEAELLQMESQLGIPLPDEYCLFLKCCRYLVMDDGRKIWGFDHEGISPGRAWV